MRKYLLILVLMMTGGILTSCGEEELIPRPVGYFRIHLPEAEYQQIDSTFPIRFEMQKMAQITPSEYDPENKNWFNIYYPKYKAKLYLTYHAVDTNLNILIDDAHRMAKEKHLQKASSLSDHLLAHPENKVYGLGFEIHGAHTASPMQFYVTDSTDNFLRGSLYFNLRPNNDSLAPVIDYLKKDIYHLIKSLEWKNYN